MHGIEASRRNVEGEGMKLEGGESGEMSFTTAMCIVMPHQPLEGQTDICQGIKEWRMVFQAVAILWPKVKWCEKCGELRVQRRRRLSAGASQEGPDHGRQAIEEGMSRPEAHALGRLVVCQAVAKRSLATLRFLTSLSARE